MHSSSLARLDTVHQLRVCIKCNKRQKQSSCELRLRLRLRVHYTSATPADVHHASQRVFVSYCRNLRQVTDGGGVGRIMQLAGGGCAAAAARRRLRGGGCAAAARRVMKAADIDRSAYRLPLAACSGSR